MEKYRSFHGRSITDREGFWREQAAAIDWQTPFQRVLDYDKPPFAKWFVGGTTNLCHNAVDRHLKTRGGQNALIYISTETGEEKTYTYRELHAEVNRCAAMMRSLGVGPGDRVIIYMPMVPETIAAWFAIVRMGGIVLPLLAGFDLNHNRGRVFDYDGLGGCYEKSDFATIGSGSDFAEGALRLGYRDDMTIEECIELGALALYEAGDNDPSTGGPDFVRNLFPIIVVVTAEGFSELPVERTREIFEAINSRRAERGGRAGGQLR